MSSTTPGDGVYDRSRDRYRPDYLGEPGPKHPPKLSLKDENLKAQTELALAQADLARAQAELARAQKEDIEHKRKRDRDAIAAALRRTRAAAEQAQNDLNEAEQANGVHHYGARW